LNEKDGTDGGKRMASNGEVILTPFLRNGVKISFQFQANYFGVSQLSFEANSSAIERKRWDGWRQKNGIKWGSYFDTVPKERCQKKSRIFLQ